MDIAGRIEKSLIDALNFSTKTGCPPRLSAALHAAVFPKGARVRPRLCHAVAHACGDDQPDATAAAGVAIELLHCASLVHDDLPCFDNADLRRGRPSVHAAFGEPLAVLAGDALIVLAFQTLGRAQCSPERLAKLILVVGNSVGVPRGHRRGSGLGVRGPNRPVALSSLENGRIVRGSVRCGCGRRRSSGPRSLEDSRRKDRRGRIRSLTIFAMRRVTKTRPASRWARTWRMAGRVP